MGKERLYAIVLGFIMISSLVGFAGIYMFVGDRGNDNQNNIDLISNRLLTPDEKLLLLRNGFVIIENIYDENCTDCLERNVDLEAFARKFQGFVAIEHVMTNQTLPVFQMIGSNGDIVELNSTDSEYLTDIFCEISIRQPEECLLRMI